ncbi:uncharacterized protein LOC106153290 [Lingula anatina]|uniref:Uncharacterized protein LOC106153290 n=1 Tax=Lingula anatina TaxID=7574 RepID=A0A1S3H9D3_LINAN|nr:uncharacterized protein LOC106153290 [Lingula anatina]|eukprot:XP_013382618.1 uncharacterized protein LOC106153290 [Lingula anatina]
MGYIQIFIFGIVAFWCFGAVACQTCSPVDDTQKKDSSAEFLCPGKWGYYEHADCTKYIMCSWGAAHTMPCPKSLVWDQVALTCNYRRALPSNHRCKHGPPQEDPEPTGMCSQPFHLHDNRCYFINTPSIQLGWEKARQLCSYFQADLVAIETRTEHEYLKTRIREMQENQVFSGSCCGDYWTSSSMKGRNWWTSGKLVNGEWVWTATGATINSEYWGFADGEPNQVPVGEAASCVGLYVPDYDFHDVMCNVTSYCEYHGYICEKGMTYL